jgi:L-threonylcarbamoyladenylate synthase
LAPGGLPSHYAPKRPIKIVDSAGEIENPHSGFLAFRRPELPVPSRYVRVLSERGDLREAATRFFSCLHDLDRDDVEIIYAERIPGTGLGRAMMERLLKASKAAVF